MDLHIKDRLYLTMLLPANNTFMEYSIKSAILKKIGLTEHDRKKFDIKEVAEENKLVWNSELDAKEPVSVTFTKDEVEFIRKGCEAIAETPHADDFWQVVERIYNENT